MPSAPLSLVESAERLGRWAWAEGRAFEILGRWSVDEEHPGARVLFAAHSAHHGWRAELLRDRLPQLADRSPANPLSSAPSSVVSVFDEVAGQTATLSRLVAAYGVVLPQLVTAYTHHAGVLSPVSDTSTARLLRILIPDVEQDRLEGEKLLDGVVGDEPEVMEARALQERLLGSFEDGAGILGFGSTEPPS